jgi:serine protease Do
MKRGIFFAFLCAMVVGATALALVSAAFVQPEVFRQWLIAPSPGRGGAEAGNSKADIVAAANPGVVTVIATRALAPPQSIPTSEMTNPSDSNVQRGTGAGFVIDAAGFIVTNEHVIKDADRIRIKLSDGREQRATVQGIDPATDLALLKIEAEELTVLRLGDSDQLRVGDPVVAIGNPLEYEHSVTAGIISALGRKVYHDKPYENFIQTDAAINRGNSGGPLLNQAGEVIGVNTVIRVDGRGISFAVPSNVVKPVIAQLRAHGFVARGYLGLRPENLTAEFRDGLGLQEQQGILVADVSTDKPAWRAGVQPYDVITHLDGQPIRNKDDFFGFVANKQPLQQIELALVRSGQPLKVYATLEARPDNIVSQSPAVRPVRHAAGLALGFIARDIAPEAWRDLTVEASSETVSSGVLVAEVDPLGPAAGQLATGSIIIEANRQPIRNLEDFQRVTATLRAGSALVLRVVSNSPQDRRLIALRVGEDR